MQHSQSSASAARGRIDLLHPAPCVGVLNIETAELSLCMLGSVGEEKQEGTGGVTFRKLSSLKLFSSDSMLQAQSWS